MNASLTPGVRCIWGVLGSQPLHLHLCCAPRLDYSACPISQKRTLMLLLLASPFLSPQVALVPR